MEHTVLPAWALLAYLASGVLFILALRGLSSPATSRSGNRYGMIGMAIAVVTTLVTHVPETAGAPDAAGGVGLADEAEPAGQVEGGQSLPYQREGRPDQIRGEGFDDDVRHALMAQLVCRSCGPFGSHALIQINAPATESIQIR